MRWALLWVLAITVAAAMTGCFNPDFQAGGECAPDMSCPGDLVCVEGVCCEPGGACGGDGDGDADAAPDADPRAFTDFLEPYTCDPDTLALLHFDSAPFAMDSQCVEPPPIVVQIEPRTDTGLFADAALAPRFGPGARLNFGTEADLTEFVDIDFDSGSEAVALTVEGWFQVRDLPVAPKLATIASALNFDSNSMMFNKGAWAVSVDSESRLRVDLRTADCDAFHPGGPLFVDALPSGVMTHFRVVIEPDRAEVFVDGLPSASATLAEPPCLDPTSANFRIGGIARNSNFEGADYERFRGVVDEIRYSRVAR